MNDIKLDFKMQWGKEVLDILRDSSDIIEEVLLEKTNTLDYLNIYEIDKLTHTTYTVGCMLGMMRPKVQVKAELSLKLEIEEDGSLKTLDILKVIDYTEEDEVT